MKKNISDALRVRNKRILKFLIMSKCILLLVIISSLQSFSKGYSQDKISINLHNVSLKTALKEIAKKSDYRFLYSDAVINGFDNKINVQVNDATINQVVSQVLANSELSFKVSANLVLITKPIAIAITVRGKITDSKNQPLPGVTIFEKSNPTNATITDGDGNYSISVADRNSVLVIRYVGFVTKEITVGTQTTIDASLEEENATLNEVVVVGYGTQKRGSVTGAVSSVKGAELLQAPVPNITNSVLGRVTGVTGRQSNGGRPGSGGNSDIFVRGTNTATGPNNPLIIVDNVRRDNINQVDPNAIETVTILKDAAATAPYGLGGANGVILITTKQGKTGAPTISLNAWYGVQNPTYMPEVLKAEEYMTLRNEAYRNENPTGTNFPYPQSRIDNYPSLSAADPDRYPRNNVTDIIKKNAPQQSYNVQVSGGSDRVKYYTNLGFFNQSGMFPQVDYTRYSYNSNLEAKVTNTTTFALSITGSSEIDRSLDPGHQPTNLLRSTFKYNPLDVYKFSNGLWGASVGLSPYSTLMSGGYSRNYYNQQLMSASIEQKLPIKGLSIKGVVSYDPVNQYQKQYHKPFYYYTVNLNTTPYTYSRAVSTSEGLVAYTYLFEQYNRAQNFTYQGYLNYHNTFGKHDITGLIVAEARNRKTNFFNSRINNYALDMDEFNFGSSNKNDYTIQGTSGTESLIGYVYRVSDTYDGKYTIEATGRYDGHFAFAPGKRWGYFPAFSAGWIISNENFMKNISWINYLKVRGSWGRTGNLAGGGNFQFIDAYNLGGNVYAFGNGVTVQGTTPQNQANPDITWEVAEKTDIGFEAIFFKGKLNLDFGVFKSKRSNMLFAPQSTISQEYGTGLSNINVGNMENYGIEISAGTQHRFANGLQLSLNGNFTYANNKTIQIFENASTFNNPNRRRTGRQWNAQYGYKALGLFHLSDDKNGDGIINATDGYNITQFSNSVLRPGNVKYADLSGPNGVPDGKVDINDETFIGYNPQPLITYGFTLAANWKGFDASFFFQGAAKSAIGTQGFLTVPFINNSSNTGYEYFNNRWTPATDMTAVYPRAVAAPYTNDTQPSDFWIRDASYLRLRTATVGYTIPSSVIKALKIKSIRLYVTGQNLLTFSKLKFIDPELTGGNGTQTGSDVAWPIQRYWTFGLNATF